jgi:succinyl-CoA synthetase beta subunit
MPKLNEHEGKRLLKKEGIKIPEGDTASTPKKAFEIAKKIDRPAVIKALVGTTSRFKKGLIKFANNADEAKKIAGELLAEKIKGIEIKKLLVEEKLSIKKEFYAGIVVNDSCKVKGPVLMFSAQGGIDFEQVPEEKVEILNIDILDGLTGENVEKLISKIDISPLLVKPLSKAVYGLYKVFRKYDCRSAEINPLVLTKDGKIYAADCKIIIDSASIFRHPELNIENTDDIDSSSTKLEQIALEMEKEDYRGTGFFTQLAKDFKEGDGYIGFHTIGGGAGIVASDIFVNKGIKRANYVDTSGNPPASKIYRMIKLIFAQPIDGYALLGAVIANQEQWHHAHAIVKALREELKNRPGFPIIILIAGNKEKESIEILKQGLKKLPTRVEIYGSDYVYKLDYLAEQMKKLIKEYKRGDKNGN